MARVLRPEHGPWRFQTPTLRVSTTRPSPHEPTTFSSCFSPRREFLAVRNGRPAASTLLRDSNRAALNSQEAILGAQKPHRARQIVAPSGNTATFAHFCYYFGLRRLVPG